jgi:hypothetical protein
MFQRGEEGGPSRPHHPAKPVPERFQARLTQVEGPAFRGIASTQQRGGRGRPVPGQRQIELGHLQRGLVVRPLPDCQRKNLVLEGAVPEPGFPVAQVFGKDPGGLPGKVQPTLIGETQARPLVDESLEGDPQTELVKVDIARVPDRLLQGQVPVPFGSPAAPVDVSVLEPTPAGHGHHLTRLHHPQLETDRGGGQLPGGGRRVTTHGRTVEQGAIRIARESIPPTGIDPSHEIVGVEGGGRVEGQNTTVLGIQGHDRPPERVGEDLVDPFRQGQVQVQMEVRPCHGGSVHLPLEGAHDPADGIHLHIANAVAPLEELLVLPLEPLLADDHPLAIAVETRALQFGGRDLTDVPQDVSHCGSRVVAPPRSHLEEDPGKLHPSLLQSRHLIEVRRPRDEKGEPGVPGCSRHQGLDPFLGKVQVRPEPFERGPDRIPRGRKEGDGVRGHVFRDDPPLAVEDRPSRRRHGEDTQTV